MAIHYQSSLEPFWHGWRGLEKAGDKISFSWDLNMANSGVETDLLSEIQNAFLSEKQNLVVQNVGTQYDPVEVCLDRSVAETVNHVFKHKVRETDERSRVQFVPIYVPDDTSIVA